jgi:hypothetical protein
MILCLTLRMYGNPLKSRRRLPCITALGYCRLAEWAPDGHHQGFWTLFCRDNCQIPHCTWTHWSLTRREWWLWYWIVWGRNYSWLSSVNHEFMQVLCVTYDAVLHS